MPSVNYIPLFVFRNESHQEQLWEISIKMIKEFLTPELLERYGPTLPIIQQEGEEHVQRATSDTDREGDAKPEKSEGDVKQEQKMPDAQQGDETKGGQESQNDQEDEEDKRKRQETV